MGQKLSNRFAGQEQEIAREIIIHGRYGAMTKRGVSCTISWNKYVEDLKKDETLGFNLSGVKAFGADNSGFVQKFVATLVDTLATLKNQNRELVQRNQFLEVENQQLKEGHDYPAENKLLELAELCFVKA